MGHYSILLKMNKLLLIAFGVLAIAAIVSAWDNEEDSSLSEDLASSRLVRSLEDRRRKGRKGRKGRNGRKGRKSQSGARSDGRASAECFEASHTMMKVWRDVVGNFDKQHKRIDKQN